MPGVLQNRSLRSAILFLNFIVIVGIVVWYSHGQETFHFLTTVQTRTTLNATDVRSIYENVHFDQTKLTSISHRGGQINISHNLNTSSNEDKDAHIRISTTTPRQFVMNHTDINNNSNDSQTCNFIHVNAFDPTVTKLTKKFQPINCTAGLLSLVYIDEPYIKVNTSKIKSSPNATGFLFCRYRPVIRGDSSDNKLSYGKWSGRFNTSIIMLDSDEHVEVICYDNKDRDISATYKSRIIPQEKDKKATLYRYINHLKRFLPKETMNVLMVGIDGLSVQNFERSMPKTNEFIQRELGSTVLRQFTKIGYNTFPNLMVLLTGRPAEYYATKTNWTVKQPFDKINDYFVWSEFQKAGYRTGLDLEEYYITAFHYLKKGWSKQPVDFYSRPSVLAMHRNKKLNTVGKFCKGDKPCISFHNDFLVELATRFNNSILPYFAFSFLTRLTHDNQNVASSGDDLYLSFFQKLKHQNLLHNTVLILFSDHGARFGALRYTYNGMIESRTPVCHIVLPSWFRSRYPVEWDMLQTNANRLTSGYDVHATLRDIMYFKSPSKPPSKPPTIGLSLFQKPISKSRTCQDAGIPIEYCNCNSLTKVTLEKKTETYLASVVTKSIMGFLVSVRDKCQTLLPKSVLSVLESPVPQDRIKSIFRSNSTLYQMTVATTPGHGVFEAVVELSKTDNKAKVIGSISRLDMYKGEKDCITDSRIRIFCLCK